MARRRYGLWTKRPCSVAHSRCSLGNSMAVPVMRWIGERIDRLMPVAAVAPKPRFNFGRLT